jgi:hypothetical protein
MTDETIESPPPPTPSVGLDASAFLSAIQAASIPPRIATNIMELMKRVKCEGEECIAWAEAYAFLQARTAAPQGVPFQPGKPA